MPPAGTGTQPREELPGWGPVLATHPSRGAPGGLLGGPGGLPGLAAARSLPPWQGTATGAAPSVPAASPVSPSDVPEPRTALEGAEDRSCWHRDPTGHRVRILHPALDVSLDPTGHRVRVLHPAPGGGRDGGEQGPVTPGPCPGSGAGWWQGGAERPPRGRTRPQHGPEELTKTTRKLQVFSIIPKCGDLGALPRSGASSRAVGSGGED